MTAAAPSSEFVNQPELYTYRKQHILYSTPIDDSCESVREITGAGHAPLRHKHRNR